MSISKDTLFHVSEFLEKIVFQFTFEIIKWVRQLQIRRQTVPNYWRRIWQFFLTRTRALVSKQVLAFAWFWPEDKSPQKLQSVRTKVLIKSFIPVWLLLYIFFLQYIHFYICLYILAASQDRAGHKNNRTGQDMKNL